MPVKLNLQPRNPVRRLSLPLAHRACAGKKFRHELLARRSPGVVIAGIFAFIAGFGEIVVGFTGNYLGILSHSMSPSFSTGVVGLFYSLGGFFLLVTRKKWGAILSISLIGAEILGRVILLATGVAPGTGLDAIKILIGGLIAFGLIVYIFSKWKSFD